MLFLVASELLYCSEFNSTRNTFETHFSPQGNRHVWSRPLLILLFHNNSILFFGDEYDAQVRQITGQRRVFHLLIC